VSSALSIALTRIPGALVFTIEQIDLSLMLPQLMSTVIKFKFYAGHDSRCMPTSMTRYHPAFQRNKRAPAQGRNAT